MKLHKLQSGFTLLELLLYMAILVVILVAIVGLLRMLMEVRVKNRLTSEVQEQGQLIVYELNRAIKNGSSITTPTAGVSGATLTMVMQDNTISPTTVTLTGSQITMKQAAGAAVALNNTLVTPSSLSFTNLTRSGTFGTVSYSFILTAVNASGISEFSYSSTFYGGATLRK
jgi:prepilin-type N-terminal cleavage/methylation domain-containing protein